MRQVEKEEERLAYADADKQCFHLCIINLVIGTLYCAKGNFEFGISRIIKSLGTPLAYAHLRSRMLTYAHVCCM